MTEERNIGGHYEVNVKLTCDFIKAAKNDDLNETIDYVVVNKIVKEEMSIPSKLIEHVAFRIITRFKNELKTIESVFIEIVKICPPIQGDVESVSVVIEEKF